MIGGGSDHCSLIFMWEQKLAIDLVHIKKKKKLSGTNILLKSIIITGTSLNQSYGCNNCTHTLAISELLLDIKKIPKDGEKKKN